MEDVPDLEFGVLWRVGASPTSRTHLGSNARSPTNIWFHSLVG